jgi:hypothetical protein
MSIGVVLGFGLLLLVLVAVAILLLVRLVARVIRDRSCPWEHIAALSIIVGIMLLFWFGRGLNRVLILRTQLMVARTGGQASLQVWAVEIMAKPRSLLREHGDRWEVPREYYSEQVLRLHPFRVFIAPIFKGGQEGLCLEYPMPHEGGLEIRIGPPGAVPVEHGNSLKRWSRCGDGLYNWFME